jgi:hypothetical protein
MPERKVSPRGLSYLTGILKRKPTVITKALLWGIPHRSGEPDTRLKLGRYRVTSRGEGPETEDPKSELTLDQEELAALLKFLGENLEPFELRERQWVALDESFGHDQAEQLKALFANPDKRKLLEFLDQHEVVPEDLVTALQHRQRVRAVTQLEAMLEQNLVEATWQRWFETNDWVLGSEFVRILEERAIDLDHISDYLMQAYDGFLDLVEIKRPEGSLKFWADSLDHGNHVPHADLIKAITQASRYLYEVEREANSQKFLERLSGVKAIKPRCVLIYGRSHAWSDSQREAYRILNAGYHNLSILTYDHVLARARRILDLSDSGGPVPAPPAVSSPFEEDIPF